MVEPIIWDGKTLQLLDQRKLPLIKEYVICKTLDEVCESIKNMTVRGAPAIGVTAAFGFYLGIREGLASELVAEKLISTRPTAVNLKWAVDRMMAALKNGWNLEEKAKEIFSQDISINRKIGENGAKLINSGFNILTHCNAGALATAGYGTAVGVIRAAHEQKKDIHVYVDETRPYLQGARLTAFELNELGIKNTLICDNMAGYLMSKSRIDFIVVGADRIAKNGDVANKIGTYSLAVLASYHGIPLYVAAPFSTFDPATETGGMIRIEERDAKEIREIGGIKIVEDTQKCFNPAFDVTPAALVTGIITELGIFKPCELFESYNKFFGGKR
ncbi:S-methyl-5-thioribose-1-phosphate isomerase [Deferribacteraceae bacterium V6Fe1]|nr:S-methyl-5-thioribose-1-phosphate isomerase [Deferribacteraceae bacterium V6Fe1]